MSEGDEYTRSMERKADRLMRENDRLKKMVGEVVDSVNNMSAEDGQAAAWSAGYGRPGDHRSFWD